MLLFRGFGDNLRIQSLFGYLPAGQTSFIIFVNVVVFSLAFFLDFFEIAFIVLPLVAPIAPQLDTDMVFMVLLAVNLQTSSMHPPFGVALYNLRSVTPSSIRTSQIYWGAAPFLLIQVLMVGLLIALPQIVASPQVSPAGRPIFIELPSPLTTPEASGRSHGILVSASMTRQSTTRRFLHARIIRFSSSRSTVS